MKTKLNKADITSVLPSLSSHLRLLHAVWKYSGVSRVDLAHSLGLDKSTVGAIVNELLEKKIIEEVEFGRSGPAGGRRPVALAISRTVGTVAGIEIQPDVARIQLIDVYGKELCHYEEKRRASLQETVFAMVRKALQLSGERNLRLLGVGFGLAGIIDSIAGVIHSSIPLRVQTALPLADLVRKEFGIDVIVENDARCCALNIVAFDMTEEARDFVYILLERHAVVDSNSYSPIGLGFSFVFDGRVHRGASGSAGEFRSMLWKPGNTSQFSINDVDLARMDEDAGIRQRLIGEIAAHVALFVNSLDVFSVRLGGDNNLANVELAEAIAKTMESNRPYRRSRTIAVKLDGAVPMVAKGAAAAYLECLMGSFDFYDTSFDLLSVLKEPDCRKRQALT
ncbi:MAG: hypothetical protein A2087_03190 [Spirochaetes bacterium GWD1_61_31]|nr:MAG: hypothetical protein A2Y37_12715 [Spirochaetes bacterium GWB1_60_80]OHD32933.1 MAG: hypothetical protein A2004_00990 [Spirochaetes bacterium GWC1_61_12]OHD38683.1 MAG: hypothetical protein A2087_03190 [Spirochaetes bacterium GWD1_61_31]OHD43208.1 MAG: hypothetical protein A2Y35_08240 [Spirochaetes bacterium GWE1_60_18]OHD58771.1 MAG: hypothetical protein A2Y32_01080 [Spirochaetes bacterium GWF1_60_12]HAP42684.1 hypothetical protein [Spirochaetaceae bacterium]